MTVEYATAASRTLANAADRQFADADAFKTLEWAGRTFGSRIVVASSMADEVVAHLASRAIPGVDVVFLDTGYHFPQTLEFRRWVATRLDVNVIDIEPELTVAQQDAAYGAKLHGRDPDACCRMRKVEPLHRALDPYDAWISGVRRDESASRATTAVVAWDAPRGKLKINPVAGWSQADVDAYALRYGLRVNPLRLLGYASIGCAPCTRAVEPGEDERAGRWAGFGKTECGLHG